MKSSGVLRACVLVCVTLAIQVGCCSIELNCGSRSCGMLPGRLLGTRHAGCLAHCDSGCSDSCGHSCGTSCSRDPLFDGTVRHRVKGHISSCANKIACAGGCGEIYWDESINDPRECDRCDSIGEWTGASNHCSPWFSRLCQWWGTPYRAPCGGHTGCSSCGHGVSSVDASCPSCQHENDLHMDDESVIYDGPTSSMVPTKHGYSQHSANASRGGLASPSPTPAKPKAANANSAPAGTSAQSRIRLHKQGGEAIADPHGKLSVQLVNGQKRLVSTP